MSKLGADKPEARSGALSAEEAALNLRDLPTDFESLVDDVKKALDEEPGAKDPWESFGPKNIDHMTDVSDHAETLATNIGASVDDIEATESNAVDEFNLARPPNGTGQNPELV